MDPFLGQIILAAFSFAPRGFALCDGSLLNIFDHEALFSLLGTVYGGDGQRTFGLPDLRGRSPVNVGAGAGLSAVELGQKGGAETVKLTTAQQPAHSHLAAVSQAAGTSTTPAKQVPATSSAAVYAAASDASNFSPTHIRSTGGNQAHENRPPYLGLNYFIAVEGIYPTRP